MSKVVSYVVIFCLCIANMETATLSTTITTSAATTSIPTTKDSESTIPITDITTTTGTKPSITLGQTTTVATDKATGNTTVVEPVTTVDITTVNLTSESASAKPSLITSTNSITSSQTTRESITSESTTKPKKTTTYTTISSGSKESSLSLEEKQKRNGITSAVICVGSLFLIGIAYLSSFVDKPSEKILHEARKYQAGNSRYINDKNGRIVKDHNPDKIPKKISFDEGFVPQKIPKHQVKQRQNGTENDNERPGTSSEYTEMVSVGEKISKVQNEQGKKNKERSGWGILTDNPKYFDDYQIKRTNTNIEEDVKL